MDWNVVIERNQEALRRILAGLVGMAGMAGSEATLPRQLHRVILRLLRPAEAAARRLVIIVARDLVVAPPRPRKPRPRPVSIFVRPGSMRTGIVLPYGVKSGDILPNLVRPRPAPSSLALPLFDPSPKWPGQRRLAARSMLRISIPGAGEPGRPRDRRPPLPGDPIDARRLALRLQALGRALDDLPREATRFALWRARRDAAAARVSQDLAAASVQLDPSLYGAGAQNRKGGRRPRIEPLRPGRPPGSCRRSRHEVHEVLKDLQYFAHEALKRPDTS